MCYGSEPHAPAVVDGIGGGALGLNRWCKVGGWECVQFQGLSGFDLLHVAEEEVAFIIA